LVKHPIQTDDVVVALCSIEVDSKPSRVASRVWELSAKGNGTEANKDWRLLAASLQKVGLAASSASSQYLPLEKNRLIIKNQYTI
jgi:hypothetical protein